MEEVVLFGFLLIGRMVYFYSALFDEVSVGGLGKLCLIGAFSHVVSVGVGSILVAILIVVLFGLFLKVLSFIFT